MITLSDKKFEVLRNKGSQGMTLLEVLVALGLFAFMFVFIVQFLQQSYRHAGKVKRDIQWKSSLSNVVDLMRRDFQGVAYFMDLNENLKAKFFIYEDLDENHLRNLQFPIYWDRDDPLQAPTDQKDLKRAGQRRDQPLFFSPHFVFEGKDDELRFISHSFSNLNLDRSSAQWVNVRYFIQDCSRLKNNSSGSCLARSTSRYWSPLEKREPEETFVLLKKFDSLKFSYMDTKDFLDRKWREQWKLGIVVGFPNSSLSYPKELPFPLMVKMEIRENDHKQTLYFPVSSSYLKAWNPNSRAYHDFPKWTPPKEKKSSDSKKPKPGLGG